MPSTRTPEGTPGRCPVCGKTYRVEVSNPPGDSTCPRCGVLLWPTKQERRFFNPAVFNPLVEVLQNLHRGIELDDVLSRTMDIVLRLFPLADRGFISLVDDSGTLVPRWVKQRRAGAEQTIGFNSRLADRTMERKEAILAAVSSAEAFGLSQDEPRDRARSVMSVPLVDNDGTAIGVLQIGTLDPKRKFDKSDLKLLVTTAVQASFVIQNARRHEQALHDHEIERDLMLAREVHQGFLPTEQPDVPEYEFFSLYHAANHIAGDYYDYVHLSDGRIVLIVADVVGGIVDDVDYESVSHHLQLGDSLIAFTNGIFDATNESGLPFIESMRRIMGAPDGSPQTIGESIEAGLRTYTGDEPLVDDRCLISFGRVLPAGLAVEVN